MWLVIGLTTLVGPIAIVAFRKIIERKDETPAIAAA
jgi:hypothetical protein